MRSVEDDAWTPSAPDCFWPAAGWSVSRTAANRVGSPISGRSLRRDCLAASRARRRQRSARFAAAWARCLSVRSATIGTIRPQPSSTAFSMAHSIRSNLKTLSSRVTGSCGCRFQFAKECEVDAVAIDGCDAGEPGAAAGDNVKLHAWLGAEHTAEMLGLIAVQGRGALVPCVCDPAAARHEQTLPCEKTTVKTPRGTLACVPRVCCLFRLTCLLLLRCLLCRLLGRLLGCLLCCHGFYSPLCCNTDVAVTECIEWWSLSVKKKIAGRLASFLAQLRLRARVCN